MRAQTHVVYELNIINEEGEYTEVFSHDFDSEIYEEDIDGTDMMMINFEMEKLKKKYGEMTLLLEWCIERNPIGRLLH